MKKIISLLSITAISLLAADANTSNTSSGFYIGAGVGSSFYNVALSQGTYYIQDNENPDYSVKGDDLLDLDDIDLGYTLYAGYLFNKIIGVEGSFTDYGSFSGTIKEKTVTGRVLEKTYTKKPKSMAVYANAGYAFFNEQLRPFGIAGLAYMKTYQSDTYRALQFEDDFVAFHYGLGVSYTPTALKGFGVRATYIADSYADYNVNSYEDRRGGTHIKSTTLWQTYSLFSVNAQYAF